MLGLQYALEDGINLLGFGSAFRRRQEGLAFYSCPNSAFQSISCINKIFEHSFLPVVNVAHGWLLDMKWVEAVSGALFHHCFDMLAIGVIVAHDFYH